MKKYISFLIIIFLLSCISQGASPIDKKDLKLLQLNVWMSGSRIENGIEAVADVIISTDADLVTLSEVSTDFMESLISTLQKKNTNYHYIPTNDCGIITRYPIVEQQFIYSPEKGFNGILKSRIALGNKQICLYSAHLDYKHYGAFLPRGYDGQTWKKMAKPVITPDSVLAFNNESQRDEQIKELIKDAALETKKGNVILVAGDFNEPSHLDWNEATKDLFDHKGSVVPWPCTLMLQNAGFIDTYRELYPNPVTHPGFTWPGDNPLVGVTQLSWAPESDERDRIDFIFFRKNQGLSLKNVTIVGPSGTILKGKRDSSNIKDPVLTPNTSWPSDHKGLLATFSLKIKS
ncbi:MAG TPA: endonuclease/exonuclease/phosphatase family protein [Bacteroidales bacterium]|nr:endonuclease/exonuclease/phosphatase family protein [Bacteroidales bacterium]